MKKTLGKKLVTHNGSFHTDDIFAAATLSLYLEKIGEEFEIVRTRDEEVIKSADYVFDVGGVYDPETNRFDHHQKGGAGRRSRVESEGEKSIDIEYASFGLVWNKFGIELCSSQEAVDLIEKKLVAPVDAFDNGIAIVEYKSDLSPYTIQRIFELLMRPTWNEDISLIDEFFKKCVEMAKEILKREIKHAEDKLIAQAKVLEFYNSATDKRIIILDKHYPAGDVINSFPEPLYIVSPRREDNFWAVVAVSNHGPKTFINRKDFPSSWAGLRDEDLQKVTGVTDAIFCHRALFLAVAESKEGAIALAHKALGE